MKGDSMTKANSQIRKALAALRQGKHLTQRIAIHLWAAYRLSSIITRLRVEGWNINTKLVPNGNGSRHAVYTMGRPHKVKGVKGAL